jgi:maltooligosyltrehalose trehalohydrolase
MHLFRVWAPLASKAELVLGDRRVAMSPADGGWFETEVDAAHGDTYLFSIEGGEPRPDPRSPWQPQGVDGPSAVVDHALFEWSDPGWKPPPLPEWIIYELHLGTFTPAGTFDAAIDRLDHLVQLGITAVELLPVNEFSGDHGWGYDGVDLYAPHHVYGGPEALKRFVNACHERDLCVVLDVVYNHLGPAGNYLAGFGPYFTDAYATPWGDALNFDDAHSDEVRSFFIDNACMWLADYHFDALRLDAVHAIIDTSAVHFLEEMRGRVDDLAKRCGRTKYLIAESDLNDPRVVRSRELGGYGMDAQWSDDFHHALHAVLTGERTGYYADFGTLADLATALRQAFVYDGRFSEHRQRHHGRPPAGLTGHSFLAYIQNHDQIGNRARGERSSHLMSDGLLKVGAALVLTSPFIPMLFQGEEWGASSPFQYFTNHPDPKLGRAVSAGRKREFASFGWDPADVPDPQDAATFERSKLGWDELAEQPHAGLLEWHRSLIRLRKEVPALRDGRMDQAGVRFDEAARWLVLERGPVTIACNFSNEPVQLEMYEARRAELLLTSSKPPAAEKDTITLDPESTAIYTA